MNDGGNDGEGVTEESRGMTEKIAVEKWLPSR